ncbi:hypothetical protein [Bacillus sp. ISL-46]|uniref:hypothetical protein n=1 Tax=Bacillus sp. ISL-46 TaxID=2819129 RepID=UPI001BE6F191|nr:hypothetical protein [Bacillus sp. ISL-46]MBT2719862.1 hypothetical protein [Bacillus sp. ISL-46]
MSKGIYNVKAILHEEAKEAYLNGAFVNLHIYHEDGSDVYEDYVWIEFPEPLKSLSQDVPIEYITHGLKFALSDWAFVVKTDMGIEIELNELGKAFLKVIRYVRPQLEFLADAPHMETRSDL